MSQHEAHKSKKRKHAATAVAPDTASAEPSIKRPKKEKEENKDKGTKAAKQGARVDKGDGRVKAAVKSKGKGKGRAAEGAFRVVRASLTVSVPPVFAMDLRGGVEELLDSMLMRYIPALQGVVLAHDRLEFLGKTATVKADCPFANCRVAFDATVWSPQVGMKLVGKINLCSPDHISLLVHRTFNVSIPRHHITTDSYEFEYGPAENDPEFGAGQEKTDEGDAVAEDGAEEHVDGGGRWVHKLTGVKIGDPEGHLEFTVVGMTIANQMLSLVGSIQPDPLSPEHVPQATPVTAPTTSHRKTSRLGRVDPAALSEREVDAMVEDDGAEDSELDEEDPFAMLGKQADEEERRAKEAQAEAARKDKEQKRKRKDKDKVGKEKVDVGSVGEKNKKKKMKKS